MNQFACIEAFITIVEEGSLHLAAKKLCQTDAAISKKLSRLEQNLQTKLLIRKRNYLSLTNVGQKYYHLCQQALQTLLHAQKLINTNNDTPRGPLKVTANRLNTELYLLPKVKEFLTCYPHIELTLDVAEKAPNFNQLKTDILYGAAGQGNDDVVQKRIGRTIDIICASPSYIKEKGMPQTPKDLLQLDYISHSERQPRNVIYFDDGQTITIAKPILQLNDSHAAIVAAHCGIGFIYTKFYHLEQELKEQKLIQLLPDYHHEKIPIYVFYRYQEYLDPKIRAFIDFFTTM